MRISDWSSDVCSSDLAGLQPRTGGGRAGSGGKRVAGVPRRHGAVHASRADRRRHAGVHAVARRLRHHLLHLRAEHRHLPGQGLLDGPLLGDAGGQRRLDDPDCGDRGADGGGAVDAAPERHEGGGNGAMSVNAKTGTPIIEIVGLSKRYGAVTAVDAVDLTIRRGEFFALLGPSGCGKTTLLRMLAGLELPTEGTIRIDGQDMSAVPANRRPVNMVFQSYAVFPHMSVLENVAYGLKVDGVAKIEARQRAEEALALVKLGGYGRSEEHTSELQSLMRISYAVCCLK